jgi:hypothetical protein
MSFAMTLDTVEIGNRTSKPLTVTYDGKQWTLPPYPHKVSMPRIVADVACRQHPRMGTESPYNPRDYTLLVAVEAWGHDSSPIEQSDSVERLDRSQLPKDRRNPELRQMQYRPVRDGEGLGTDAVFNGR